MTGAGVVTALGLDWASNAEGFRLGDTAFRPITLFDVSKQRVKTGAQLDLPPTLPKTRLSQRQQERLDRAGRMLLLAAWQASQQGQWPTGGPIPIVLGTTSGGMSLGEEFYRHAVEFPKRQWRQATRVSQYQAQRQALDLAAAFGLEGPTWIIANACASGANAIGHAWDLIRHGQFDFVLTGGYDALSHLVFSGFDSLQALSPTTCRPFDAHRDGLSLGEGAAVFMLESLQSAERRGANILGEIAGYGASTDVHHLTQPAPDGEAAFLSMDKACKSAAIHPEQIGYLNAHGTGTPLNDSAEASAIQRWAGPHASKLPVSSTKASIGHLLGAAGAVEIAVCLMALQGQWLPPTRTTKELDPLAQFAFVHEPANAKFQYALSNSFGFGGSNASVIVRRNP